MTASADGGRSNRGMPGTAPVSRQVRTSPPSRSGNAATGNQQQQQQARARPQHHAGDWLRRYKDLPPEQQQKALENDPQFRSLPPERQQSCGRRLQHFSSLPPQQQDRILNRMETWEHLTPEQKERARRALPAVPATAAGAPAHGARPRFRNLRQMPPEQRQQFIESDRFKSMFSPQERDLLKGATELPLGSREAAGPPEPSATEQYEAHASPAASPASLCD